MPHTAVHQKEGQYEKHHESSIYAPIAVLFLTAALAGAAVAAEKHIPFSGSLHAYERSVCQGPSARNTFGRCERRRNRHRLKPAPTVRFHTCEASSQFSTWYSHVFSHLQIGDSNANAV